MESKLLIKLGTIAASISAILAMLWFIGEPALEDYVEAHIKIHEEKQKEVNSKKVKLRTLLSDKMGIPSDEVHIELGQHYRNRNIIISNIDSLKKEILRLKRFNKAVIKELNYYHKDNLLQDFK